MADKVARERQFLTGLAEQAKRLGHNGASPRKSELPLLFVDGVAVGRLEFRGIDHYWEHGVFHALPAFETHGQLLRTLEETMEEYDRASDDPSTTDAVSQALQHQWFSLMEEVDQAVRIGTDPTTGRTVRDLKIERGWYEFKWIQ